jgi:hypothetical protein
MEIWATRRSSPNFKTDFLSFFHAKHAISLSILGCGFAEETAARIDG